MHNSHKSINKCFQSNWRYLCLEGPYVQVWELCRNSGQTVFRVPCAAFEYPAHICNCILRWALRLSPHNVYLEIIKLTQQLSKSAMCSEQTDNWWQRRGTNKLILISYLYRYFRYKDSTDDVLVPVVILDLVQAARRMEHKRCHDYHRHSSCMVTMTHWMYVPDCIWLKLASFMVCASTVRKNR